MKKISCDAGDFLYSAAVPCIIPRMSIEERIVTEMELRRNTGERGTRKFIAYQGIVYDVTDCPKWRNDLHEQLHFPGQDLTSELPEAPHREDVFSRPCVKVVGKLQTPQR
jgi:predicted heme/steroid binding protein